MWKHADIGKLLLGTFYSNLTYNRFVRTKLNVNVKSVHNRRYSSWLGMPVRVANTVTLLRRTYDCQFSHCCLLPSSPNYNVVIDYAAPVTRACRQAATNPLKRLARTFLFESRCSTTYTLK